MNQEEKKLMGLKIKKGREAKGYSQDSLAEKLGMKRTNIANYEAGRVMPPSNVLRDLADILDVTSDYLLGRDDIYGIGRIIKDERKSQRMTVKELADEVGLDEETVIQYEDDIIPLSKHMVKKIASIFGMSYSALLNKHNQYDEYIPPQFDGDVDAQKKYDAAVEKDAFNNAIETTPHTKKGGLPELTSKDERDIQKNLQKIIDDLNSEDGYAAFDGNTLADMDEEDRELLIASLENSLRLAKRIAKQKFTPKKYRK